MKKLPFKFIIGLKTLYFDSLLKCIHIFKMATSPGAIPCQSQREANPRRTVIFSRPERRPWAVILVICVVATDLSRIDSTIVDSIVMYVDDER